MIHDLIKKNRSYRRFNSSVKIEPEKIEKWIELARFSPSARNLQPLKFAFSTDEEINKLIFPHLGWAGYLKDWSGPAEGERPVSYLAILKDTTLAENVHCDDGIAAQSILLGAVEDGFGGCIIGTVNKSKVAKILKLPDTFEILWIIALGKPSEEIVLENATGNKIEYWRDKQDVHHVPKRPLNELIYKKIIKK